MIAKYNFELNEGMIYLIETLKVEGYWSKKSFTLSLQNKDILLLNHIEEIVKSVGINISKRLLLKIRLEDNAKREGVRLIWKNKNLNFHIEKSPFNEKRIKAVTSLPYRKNYEIILSYNNKKTKIEIRCLKDKINLESDLECWTYQDLRFPTKKMLDFLEDYCGNKKKFHLEEFLLNSNEKLVMSAFSALVDCEGSIDFYGLFRRIRIRMRNKNYLNQWKDLLSKYNIKARLQKNDEEEFELCLEGWQDFNRLNELGFKLYHSKKSEKWKEMLKGFKRNQISRNSYKEFYVNKLKEIGKKITAEEFANWLNKSKRTINHFLSKLEKEKLIECDKSTWPHLYFIST